VPDLVRGIDVVSVWQLNVEWDSFTSVRVHSFGKPLSLTSGALDDLLSLTAVDTAAMKAPIDSALSDLMSLNASGAPPKFTAAVDRECVAWGAIPSSAL
jgi:hypothetical protein